MPFILPKFKYRTKKRLLLEINPKDLLFVFNFLENFSSPWIFLKIKYFLDNSTLFYLNTKT